MTRYESPWKIRLLETMAWYWSLAVRENAQDIPARPSPFSLQYTHDGNRLLVNHRIAVLGVKMNDFRRGGMDEASPLLRINASKIKNLYGLRNPRRRCCRIWDRSEDIYHHQFSSRGYGSSWWFPDSLEIKLHALRQCLPNLMTRETEAKRHDHDVNR